MRTCLGQYIWDQQRGTFIVQERVDSNNNGRSQGNGQVLSIMKAKSIDFEIVSKRIEIVNWLEIVSKRMK